MARYRPYSREVLRKLRRDWLRRNRRLAATACLVAAAVLVVPVAWAALFTSESRLTWYVVGLTHSAVVCVCLYGFHFGFLLTDPEGIKHLRGAYGEENTRDVLKAAKRRGLIWGWVDSIGLERGDLDHVVLTKRGGVLVLDSKWRNQTSVRDAEAMASAADRARSRADAIARSLLRAERGARHRAAGDAVRVQAVVVLWGAEQHRLPGGVATVGGVSFVAGRHLRTWLSQLDGEQVSKASAAQIESALVKFRENARGQAAKT